MTEFGSGILDLWHVLQKNRKNFAKSNFCAFIIPREDRLRLESFNKIFLWGQTFLLVLENLKIPKILKTPSGILTIIALEYYITGTI